jgi:hypothetical protein
VGKLFLGDARLRDKCHNGRAEIFPAHEETVHVLGVAMAENGA